MSRSKQEECWRCDGTGKIIDSKGNKKKCHVCSGSGSLNKKNKQNTNNVNSTINKNNNTNKSNDYSGCYSTFIIGIIIAVYFISCSGPDECNLCKGNKQISCYICAGSGSVKCTYCEDKTFGWFKCARCKGEKAHKCYTCNRSGKVTCYRCNGSGEEPETVTTTTPPPPRPLPKLPPYILYIYGWQLGGINYEEIEKQKNILREMFPESQVDMFKWDATYFPFGDCVNEADRVAPILANEIYKLEKHERENIILVGHSLGGRIAVRTMAHLSRDNMPIKAGYFLAAAIDCNDNDIKLAIENSLEANIVTFDKSDGALIAYTVTVGRRALGLWGYDNHYFPWEKLHQYEDLRPIEEPIVGDGLLIEHHFAKRSLTLLKEKEGNQ